MFAVGHVFMFSRFFPQRTVLVSLFGTSVGALGAGGSS